MWTGSHDCGKDMEWRYDTRLCTGEACICIAGVELMHYENLRIPRSDAVVYGEMHSRQELMSIVVALLVA